MITQLLLIATIITSFYPVIGNTKTLAPTQTEAVNSLRVWVTAYSSTPEETDDSPFTTASGKQVREGIVATNLLPFGTKIKIPKIFGDKVFIVEDRMHRRKINFVDIWMPTRKEAQEFGITSAEIIVLN